MEKEDSTGGPTEENADLTDSEIPQEDQSTEDDDPLTDKASDIVKQAAANANKSLDPNKEHHENIFDILTNQEEITWRSIIVDLIKNEHMDPWDVNVSLLAKRYIETLKALKEQNLSLSGKVLLCAALLLRIKSNKLVGDDLMEFDRLLASGENADELYTEDGTPDIPLNQLLKVDPKDMKLLPKTPQPRKRKVSVYDLIDALAVALNVRRRRILNQIKVHEVDAPTKKVDLATLMDDMYADFIGYLDHYGTDHMTFTELCPSDAPMDKVLTFIPLLHMTNSRKTDLEQKTHFGEIYVRLAKPKEEKNAEN